MNPVILLVDDEPAALFGYSQFLRRSGYVTVEALTLADARQAILSQRIDGVILDLQLPDGSGLEWIDELRSEHPSVALIVVTGKGNIPVAVEAMRKGADNFLTKPVDMTEIVIFLKKCLADGLLRRKDEIRKRLSQTLPAFFGESPIMQKLRELLVIAAQSDSPLLLRGETGSGKGVFARWVHDSGRLSDQPFVEANCASMRGELLASELFGHAKGAFTTAIQDKKGLLDIANGGTLFLDEIGDMDMAVQSQFLKVIEEKTYRRMGDIRIRQSNFRLICATNKILEEEISKGLFRKDLYYRISVFPVNIPPLRDRTDDIPALVRYLLDSLGSASRDVAPAAMETLISYSWPGNVRELRNILERAILLSRQGHISPEHLGGLAASITAERGIHPDKGGRLADIQGSYIEEILKQCRGDIEMAAAELGISRATLYRKLKRIRAAKK